MTDNCGCGVTLIIEDEEEIVLSLGDSVIIGEDYEVYTGETDITPRLQERQVLETTGKLLQDDITVEEVPVYAVTNPSGGLTYYIGE